MTENSSAKEIDLRGLPCPQPVIKTKKLFDDASVKSVVAYVDDQVNVENLSRLARSLKGSISAEESDKGFRLTITRGTAEALTSTQAPTHSHASVTGSAAKNATDNSTIVLISKDKFGDGDSAFSNNLLNLFLQTLFESGHRPQAILMLNSGVKLMSADSPFEKVLKDFKESGVEVLACRLCVEFYGLKEIVPKEQITNMFAICEYINAAAKIISP